MPFDATPITSPDIELLEGICQLLKKRGAWCQGSEAMTKAGDDTHPEDPEAAKFCLIGAYNRISNSAGDAGQQHFAQLLGFHSDDADDVGPLTDWNDKKERTKRAVLARLKRAIDKERARLLSGAT